MDVREPPPVMQTYVVRIYRRGDETSAGGVAGTVEPVPVGNRQPFDSLRQLGALLALPDASRET